MTKRDRRTSGTLAATITQAATTPSGILLSIPVALLFIVVALQIYNLTLLSDIKRTLSALIGVS